MLKIASSYKILFADAVEMAAYDRYGLESARKTTQKWFKQSMRSLEKFVGSDVCVSEVTPRQVDAWKRQRMKEVSPVTVNTNLRGVKTVYTRLQKRGIVGFNPAEPVKFIPVPRPTPKAISQKNYLKLMEAATNTRDRAIVATLWATGSRLAGLVSIQLNGIDSWYGEGGDWRAALYVVEKFEEPRFVYVKDNEAKILRKWLRERPTVEHPFLFTALRSPYRHLLSQGVQKLLDRLKVLAEIPEAEPVNAHSFRHAFAIRKLDEGYDIALVSQWLGHCNPMFTASVYAVRSEKELRKRYFEPPRNPK